MRRLKQLGQLLYATTSCDVLQDCSESISCNSIKALQFYHAM